MKVYKFGGASVKSAEAVRNVASILQKDTNGKELLVIVSAMGKTTNALENIYNASISDTEDYKLLFKALVDFHFEIIEGLFPDPNHDVYSVIRMLFIRLEATLDQVNTYTNYAQGYDQIVCFGEILSTHILAHYLRQTGTNAVWVDARQYIQTDNNWREGAVDMFFTEKLIQSELSKLLTNNVIVTQGFIGGTIGSQTTTLGREGSDYSAAIFASALNAESMTIWKDVEGVLTADPKIHPNAKLVTTLSYQQAAALTFFGASVIHPKTIAPIAAKNIPLIVRSFINYDAMGTVISDLTDTGNKLQFINQKTDQVVVKIEKHSLAFFDAQDYLFIFTHLDKYGIILNYFQQTPLYCIIAFDFKRQQLDVLTQLEYLYKVRNEAINAKLLTYTGGSIDVKLISNSHYSQVFDGTLQILEVL